MFTHSTPSHFLQNLVCHDIFMNALVAHVTNKAPISVGSSGSGGYNGEWVWRVLDGYLDEEEEEDDEVYKNEYEDEIRFDKNLTQSNKKHQKKKKLNKKKKNGRDKRDWLMRQHTCLLLVQQIYGYMPLKHSYVRCVIKIAFLRRFLKRKRADDK